MRGMLASMVLAAAAIGSAPFAFGQAPDPTVAKADYSNPALWLCKPGLADDKCRVDLDATIINANGSTSVEKFKPASNPAIDCFFVYPTVSLDPGWQSDFQADKMEWDDVKLQFARFGAVCRTFAPIYRQTTLTALRVAARNDRRRIAARHRAVGQLHRIGVGKPRIRILVVGGDELGAGGEGGFAAGGVVDAGFAGVGVCSRANEEALSDTLLDQGLILHRIVHGEIGGLGRIGESGHEGGAALKRGVAFGVGLVGFG